MSASPFHLTLTANTVATVTLDNNYGRIEVLNVDGADIVYVSNNGTAPTVAGAGFHVVPAGVGAALEVDDLTTGTTVVKLISAGTPKVSVRGL